LLHEQAKSNALKESYGQLGLTQLGSK